MSSFIDRTGRVYGRMTVLRLADDRSSDGRYLWVCRCECGNEKVAPGSQLANGSIRSCGCLRKKPHKPNGEALQNGLIARYRDGARRRGYVFDLTREEFCHLIAQNCFYCGYPPSQIYKNRHYTFAYNGLDRIDNSVGYTLDNVVTCCKTCNRAKREMEFKEFMDWIGRLVQHDKRRESPCC